MIVALVKFCAPVYDSPFKTLAIAVPTNAVVAGAVVEFPAVCVVNVTVAPVNVCVPVHVFVADF